MCAKDSKIKSFRQQLLKSSSHGSLLPHGHEPQQGPQVTKDTNKARHSHRCPTKHTWLLQGQSHRCKLLKKRVGSLIPANMKSEQLSNAGLATVRKVTAQTISALLPSVSNKTFAEKENKPKQKPLSNASVRLISKVLQKL